MSAIDIFTSLDDYHSFGSDIGDAQKWIRDFEKHFGDFMRVLKQIINKIPKEGENVDGIKILKHRQWLVNDRAIHNNIELVKNGVVIPFSYCCDDGLFVDSMPVTFFECQLVNCVGVTDEHIQRFANIVPHNTTYENYVSYLLELRNTFAFRE